MSWLGRKTALALTMVATGSLNTLSTKWADQVNAKNSAGEIVQFNHPFLQSAAMFVGEMLCLLTFKLLLWRRRRRDGEVEAGGLTAGNQNFNPLLLLPAGMLDLVGTSIMYVGLTLTYASSFQMFRGAVVVFVAALSATFLQRQLKRTEVLGIALVLIGLAVVGGADALAGNADDPRGRNAVITGDLLIVLAQVVTAAQMVYEEKYVAGLNIPSLQAVGWEGVWGFSALAILLVIFYWVPAPPHFAHNPRGVVEDAVDGLVQIGSSFALQVALLASVISIAVFNFAGISVTKEMSATTRMVLDSVRTVVIWAVSLGVRWQTFRWAHLGGFALLITGTVVYNGILSRSHPEEPLIVTEENEEEGDA